MFQRLKNIGFYATVKNDFLNGKEVVYRGIRCAVLVISILLASKTTAVSQIRVGLFDKKDVSSILISPVSGNYILTNSVGDTVYKFKSDDAVSISAIAEKVVAKSAYGLADTLDRIFVIGDGNKPSFKTRIPTEKRDGVFYDALEVSSSANGLSIVNQVDLERYVSRVVQAEVGYGAAEEYYKIQSIICRTYAIRNLERHATDGFDVCDHEHCQVYSGLKTPTNEVVKATAATSGLVMLSQENDLVLSAFHANCGGQTANSENVWKEARSYLKSVNDTFCLSSRSATWEKTFELSEFLNQLGWKDTTITDLWQRKNDARNPEFAMNGNVISTSKMRRLLQLRSAFFDVEIKNNQVKLLGKGYGHGVGLCQQGAMKMAESGYDYSQILGYYYKGVSLTPFTSLQSKE